MSSHLNSHVLVLNKDWKAVGVETVRNAIKYLSEEKRLFIDPDTYMTYTFLEWMEREPSPGQPVIHAVRKDILVPRVCVLAGKDRSRKSVKLNRHNVWVRDKGLCQYCGHKVVMSHGNRTHRLPHEMAWDHVMPRSQGGVTSWDNLVTACFRCNQRKNDRTPQQAKMPLLHPVRGKPKWCIAMERRIKSVHPEWLKFVTAEDLGLEPAAIPA